MINLHIINSLEKGGAETSLYRLCKFSNKKFNNIVITLKKQGYYNSRLQQMGIHVKNFEFDKSYLPFFEFIKLLKYIYKINPNSINGWMYHSIFITCILFFFFRKKKIFWHIRHSSIKYKSTKLKTIIIIYLEILFSYFVPNKIIYNSEVGKKIHEEKLRFKKNSLVIFNGFNSSEFFINNLIKDNYKKNNNIDNDTIILGSIGRYRIQKNHEFLFKILNNLNNKKIKFICFLIGGGLNMNNHKLNSLIHKYKLEKKIMYFDEVDNIEEFMNIIDITLITSDFGEAFPNVLAESMLCGTPCITTNIGDVKNIIQNSGWITKVNDLDDFTNNVLIALNLWKNKNKWNNLQNKCRENIKQRFSINKTLKSFEDLWLT